MITESQYQFLQGLYCYYNEKLFEGKLPDCQINLCRKKDTPGFFTSRRWIGEQHKVIHEINLNPLDLERETIEWHANLVYYMVRLWQYEFGKPPKEAGYHNKELVKKMEEIGFIVEFIRKPGGKNIRRNILRNIDPAGLLNKMYNILPPKEPEYHPIPDLNDARNKDKNKITYQCPSCGFNIWCRPNGLAVCFRCFDLMLPLEGKAGKQMPNEKYEIEQRAAKKILPLYRDEIQRLFLMKINKEPKKS